MLFEDPCAENELVLSRYRVMKNPADINKWKTYEASVAPSLKHRSWLEQTQPSDTREQTTSDAIDVDGFTCEIEQCIRHFQDALQDVENRMNVSSSLYERTFYRMPGVNCHGSRVEDKNALADNTIDYLKNSGFVYVESTLITNYVCACLEKIMLSLDCSNADKSLKHFTSTDFTCLWVDLVCDFLLTGVVLEKKNLNAALKNFCHTFSSQKNYLSFGSSDIFKVVIRSIEEITKIREKRLRLLRIVDDEGMLDFTNEQLFEELILLDKDVEQFVHPNNRRKIIR